MCNPLETGVGATFRLTLSHQSAQTLLLKGINLCRVAIYNMINWWSITFAYNSRARRFPNLCFWDRCWLGFMEFWNLGVSPKHHRNQESCWNVLKSINNIQNPNPSHNGWTLDLSREIPIHARKTPRKPPHPTRKDLIKGEVTKLVDFNNAGWGGGSCPQLTSHDRFKKVTHWK